MGLVHFREQIQSAVNTYNFMGTVTTCITAKIVVKRTILLEKGLLLLEIY